MIFALLMCVLSSGLELENAPDFHDDADRERRGALTNCVTTAEHRCGVAGGWQAHSSGDSSIALGNSVKAIGKSCLAVGGSSVCSGTASAAIGSYCKAEGRSSTAMNYATVAKGPQSFAQGYGTQALHEESTAMGLRTVTNSHYEVVIGKYNKVGIDENHLFTVGNGYNITERSDAFYVTQDGDAFVMGELHVSGKHVDFQKLEATQKETKELLENFSSETNNNLQKITSDIYNNLQNISSDIYKRLGKHAYDILQTQDMVSNVNQVAQDSFDEILSVSNDVKTLVSNEVALKEQLAIDFANMQDRVDKAEARAAAAENALESAQADIKSLFAMIENLQKPCDCEDKHGCRP
eukprot:m.58030 g.58030  ORF g.58030 m.58030 type:complete len:352 (+) comp11148_c0_seq2:185-1240(+)